MAIQNGGKSTKIWTAECHQIFSGWEMQTIKEGCARGVMVIVVGSGHGDTSSNPGPG